MSLTPQDRREIRSDSNFLGGQAVKWIIISVLVVLIIATLLWGLGVATSGVKGQGDAQRQKNSAANWTKQQAEFERMYASIKAQDKNITIAHAEAKANPNDQTKQINYSGLVRNCNDTVGNYNAMARSYLAEQFRAADLPAQIDDTDPATDCKENSK